MRKRHGRRVEIHRREGIISVWLGASFWTKSANMGYIYMKPNDSERFTSSIQRNMKRLKLTEI